MTVKKKRRQAKQGDEATWYLYMLKCNDGSLYTGLTNDLDRRLGQHGEGTASRYTRSRLPVRLVYTESWDSRSSALAREYAVKSLSRTEKDALVKGKGSKR